MEAYLDNIAKARFKCEDDHAEKLTVSLRRSLDSIFEFGGEWDRLLEESNSRTIFLTSGWLRAWYEALGKDSNLLIPLVRKGHILVGAAAFQETRGVIRFAGEGPSDYMDLVISATLNEHESKEIAKKLLDTAREGADKYKCFRLSRIPSESKSISHLFSLEGTYYSTICKTKVAPSMEMTAADKNLRKKSLRRHEKGLQKQGNVVSITSSDEDSIMAELEDFFEQHIKRWDETPFPSIFLTEGYRLFYQLITKELGKTGWLRFTRILLNERLVASHYGFLYHGRFVWYKPAFDPALRKLSPGEVLIKRLIEKAKEEDAEEFDFAVGDEAFKYRFATQARDILDIHVSNSLINATLIRFRAKIVNAIITSLGENGRNRFITIRAHVRNTLRGFT